MINHDSKEHRLPFLDRTGEDKDEFNEALPQAEGAPVINHDSKEHRLPFLDRTGEGGVVLRLLLGTIFVVFLCGAIAGGLVGAALIGGCP